MNRVPAVRLFSLAVAAALAGCSGGGSTTGGVKTGGSFVVLSTEPSDNGRLFLNDPISIDFSNPVDLDSVDLTTFSFQVLNQVGQTVAEPVAGTFSLGTSTGDTTPGRRLQFTPRLPTNDLYTNGPRRSIADSKLSRVRVLGSKNSVAMIVPRQTSDQPSRLARNSSA
jgi:hypothetical protein